MVPRISVGAIFFFILFLLFILWNVVTYSFRTNFNTIIKTNKHKIAETRL